MALATSDAVLPLPAHAASGLTTRVSVSALGGDANGGSLSPSISGDGRYVAFVSHSSNLVPDGESGVYVRDLIAGETRFAGAGRGPIISQTGRYVVFSADNPELSFQSEVMLFDRETEKTTIVSRNVSGGDSHGDSYAAALSADGRVVSFTSAASDLVVGDANDDFDVYVRDVEAGTTSRVSTDLSGSDGNGPSFGSSISSDGRFVAFQSWASDLVVADENGQPDVFLRDLLEGTTVRLSVDPEGEDANNSSWGPLISHDGTHVAFNSAASNLVPGPASAGDLYVREVATGKTVQACRAADGGTPDGACELDSISGDGRLVAFGSWATNLGSGGENDVRDVFVRDVESGAVTLVSVDRSGGDADRDSWEIAISDDGAFAAFASDARDLVPEDKNRASDVFVREVDAAVITIGDATLSEGDDQELIASVPIRLSKPAKRPVEVEFNTFDKSARAGSDYSSKSGAKEFNPGETVKFLRIKVLGDHSDEDRETFAVRLTAADNATLGDKIGIVTILDNDSEPTLGVSDATVSEGHAGSSPMTFYVALSQASGKTVTVTYATVDGTATSSVDLTPISGSLSFSPGEWVRPVTVEILGDALPENTERFTLTLPDATGAQIADAAGLGRILDDDAL